MAIAIVLLIYGAITAVGGVMGYVNAKSTASLIAGAASGCVLLLSGALIIAGAAWGAYLGFAVTMVLIVVFWMRYHKTRTVMPAGMMLGITVVVAAVLFTELFQ